MGALGFNAGTKPEFYVPCERIKLIMVHKRFKFSKGEWGAIHRLYSCGQTVIS